ncbi:MBL fold metallo-hydrolase [Malonomonas rubra]|uniref:MBL fold metallo-hydrolase n=1 Tax=Malonomonas rubra TaxID=57040 RepID=UPI0026EC3EBE|nr:MBL fold metallo-hydrolase [Malonomonas rubra]
MIRDRLTCIDLDQPSLEGFRKFISCWLYQDQDQNLTFVVDPGPLSTIPKLLAELRAQQVKKLDYILLTHIHIDHAGGTGELLKFYPQAKVICHPQGIKHLIEPEKLWQGSQKVLGKLAEAYGEIIPIPEESIAFEEKIDSTGIRCFLTPGHAQHHCCYLIEDLLFGGEVAGVHSPVAEGIYMRPATPPKFILEIALASVQKMIDLKPRYLIIAHYGLVEPAEDYLKIGQRQLKLWVKGITELFVSERELEIEKFLQWLLENDPNFQNIAQLDDDIRARENYFLSNSFRGMSEFVTALSDEKRLELRKLD